MPGAEVLHGPAGLLRADPRDPGCRPPVEAVVERVVQRHRARLVARSSADRVRPRVAQWALVLDLGDAGRRVGARPVTHGNVVDVEPTWSPDGKRIAFRGDSADGRSFDLYTVRVDGSGRKDLTSDADDVSVTDPSWSTNNLIAFERTRQNAGAGTGIYTIRPDGSGLRRLCIGGFDPAWSPGGHRIAFVLPGPRGGVLEIATMSPNGTGRTFLTGGTESTAPAWSPDGSRIVFLRDTQITVMNADGSHIKQVTRPLHGANFVDTPAW